MQISTTFGAPLYIPTTFFPDNFSNLRVSTSGLPISKTCNPNFIWALQCTTLSTESTAAPENTSNSRTRDWFQAELALRYWQEHDNLYIWAPIPIYTDRVDYRSLEMALIQEWQPRLNYPFICQFFHPKKGLLKKPF